MERNELIKVGRHVGLDFYDLLIEALKTSSMSVHRFINSQELACLLE